MPIAVRPALGEEQFGVKRRGDASSYNSAAYHAHLAAQHGIPLPAPLVVRGR